MHAAVIVTIVLITLTVLVLAAYLIAIAVALRQVSERLSTVISDVRAIPGKTQPVPGILNNMKSDLTGAQGALEGLLARKR